LLLLFKDRILKEIKEKLPLTDKNLVKIILYGSVARDEYTPHSDIDLLLISKNKALTQKIFSDMRAKIYAETGVLITAIIVSGEEFEKSASLLIKKIKKEGKTLWKRKKI